MLLRKRQEAAVLSPSAERALCTTLITAFEESNVSMARYAEALDAIAQMIADNREEGVAALRGFAGRMQQLSQDWQQVAEQARTALDLPK